MENHVLEWLLVGLSDYYLGSSTLGVEFAP